MKKKSYLILGGVFLLVLVGVIGFTYAYWMITKEQTNFNIVNSDCFKIEFQESNDINLNRAYPISDADGLKLVPYTFTITNKCESWASFQINLETIEQTGVKVLPDHYLKVNLQEGNISKITTKLDKTINTELATSTTIRGATEAYKLLTGTLKSGGSKTYNLRIWMDSEVTAEDQDSMNASYQGKVSITFGYQANPFAESGTLMATGQTNTNAFWGYKESISEVIIEPEMTEKDTELLWDISANQDGSVMSYLVMNEKISETEEDSYTLYLQSKGGVKANKNSNFLFYGFTKLKSIGGLEYLDTSQVTNMGWMFSYCRNLLNLNLSNFDTSNVTSMNAMFHACNKLMSLDLSHFDTSNVTNMGSMFRGCSNLTSLDVSNFDTSNITNMGSMFRACSSLSGLNLSHFDTSKVTSMDWMFQNCRSLISLDLSGVDTKNVSNMAYMFQDCTNLTNLDLSSFDTSNVTNMSSMFQNCGSLISLNLNHFDTGKVTDMGAMISNCHSLTSLDVSNFDTSNVTDMGAMFLGCDSLVSLNLSHFDTSNLTSMEKMFSGCSKLTSLDVSNFDTSKVTSLYQMFYGCTKLVNLNVSSFDTSKVTNMENMFSFMPAAAVVTVKDEATQNWVLNSKNGRPSEWNISNVIIKTV